MRKCPVDYSNWNQYSLCERFKIFHKKVLIFNFQWISPIRHNKTKQFCHILPWQCLQHQYQIIHFRPQNHYLHNVKIKFTAFINNIKVLTSNPRKFFWYSLRKFSIPVRILVHSVVWGVSRFWQHQGSWQELNIFRVSTNKFYWIWSENFYIIDFNEQSWWIYLRFSLLLYCAVPVCHFRS